MHKYPLSFEQLCDLEKQTLKAIVQNCAFYCQPGVVSEVTKAQYQKITGDVYCFNCYWDTTCECGSISDCRLFLCEKFCRNRDVDENGIVDMSICLCVAGLDDKREISKVFRKYHFDFTRDHEGRSCTSHYLI